MNVETLAILIPAYKGKFLFEALDSIASQTCKEFTLYVCDDASPDNLLEIVSQFKNKINICYHRFNENLGEKDLVAQWERCMDLVKAESWIWLFSDDDLMEKECVEAFFAFISNNKNANFVRFNTNIIDSEGRQIKENFSYPEVLSGIQFLKGRFEYKLNSNAVEYIFRRSLYTQNGGFVNFSLGWCADDATWAKFGKTENILTINGPKINWRSSGLNISTREDHISLVKKHKACVDFFCWTEDFLIREGESSRKWKRIRIKWLLSKISKLEGGLNRKNICHTIEMLKRKRGLTIFEQTILILIGLEIKLKLFFLNKWPNTNSK